MKQIVTIILSIFFVQQSFAQENYEAKRLILHTGGTSEMLIDKNISSLGWKGVGYGIAVEYHMPVFKRSLLNTGFSFTSTVLKNNVTNYSINSNIYNLFISGYWKINNDAQSLLYTGFSINSMFNNRMSEIIYLKQVYDSWTSLALSGMYIYKGENWLGQFDLNLPLFSTIMSQDYVNNSNHSLHLGTLTNSFKIKTGISLLYNLSQQHNIGFGYSWEYYNIRINKRIDKATHFLKISYSYNFNKSDNE